jgi:cytochrome P450
MNWQRSDATARLPPGPPLPAWIQTAIWLRWPLWFMSRCVRGYGDVFTLRPSFGPPIVMVCDPDLVRVILRLGPEEVSRADENAVLAPLLGARSLLLLDGVDHARLRRLQLPHLRPESFSSQHDLVASITRDEMRRWPVGQPFPLLPSMRAITLEVILRVAFGLEGSPRLEEIRDSIRRLLSMHSGWVLVPMLRRDLGPWSPWGRFTRLRARVDGLLREEIRQRSTPGGAGMIDQLRDRMTEDELVDTLMTLLVAGHETTATSLAWCFELLLAHPELTVRLRRESDPDVERLLDAVIRETLRLRPVFRFTSRRTKKPLDLGTYRIPAGVSVAANIWLTHRRADCYEDPLMFHPERFLTGEPRPYSWIPFGGGSRRCPGASLATYEMGVVVRTVLQGARLRLAGRRPEGVGVHPITLIPRRGVRVIRDGDHSLPV